MRNKYAASCYRCGETVDPGAGHFERVAISPAHSRWRTQHADCAIAYRGTDVGNSEPKGPRGGRRALQAHATTRGEVR